MLYSWLIVVIGLAILEMATTSLVSIWFVLSGLLAMIAALFIKSLLIQVAIFVIFGLLFMLLTKKITKKIVPEKQRTNIDRIVGMIGIVTEKISKNHPGEVKVDGKRWTAISNKTIDVGSSVKVLEINSTKLTVERMEE